MTSQALPILPETAPFPPDHIHALNSVMAATSLEQRHWLSGFLAGYQAATLPLAAPAPSPAKKIPLTIAYATDSGNAEEVAANAKKAAGKQGFAAKLVDMADVTAADLADVKNLLIVASTWGEGDPPERAAEAYEALMADDAPSFEAVNFAVLALGDSSYVNFCEVGKRLDERLEQLGGRRIADRVDCDLDFDEPASSWTSGALDRLFEIAEPDQAVGVSPSADIVHLDFAASAFSKANPFPAEITELVNLNGSRSAKETYHVELSLEGSGLAFEPGDSLGITAENHQAMVAQVLMAAGLSADADLEQRLRTDFDITQLSKPVMDAYAQVTGDGRLAELLEGDRWQAYLPGRQIIDLLTDFPAKLEAEELLGLFRKLPPRLYSLASSQKAEPDLAHLLISAVRYNSFGRDREGVASTFVADRHRVGDQLKVYVKTNKNFRLPEDPDRPVIMIGPGTGVAPFRAFLQERQATAAGGGNWLFFGDRTYTHDFLYQLDWQEFEKDGVLDRIDVAFSRDQPEKIYVQDRMWQRRADLFAWLEEGAALYVCGDEKTMAKDVDAMLHRIVADQSNADAADYVSRLKKERRYLKDVY
ncbi:MAG: flavodoxin domain-containing protein [Alphaproteobacteria bacterium]|nr:flavodoxin domain-containing protein [Alphaproteobacteria bacterium]